jgi:hypothetical protein
MKKHSIFFILILLALFTGGCKYDFILPVETLPVDNGGEPISFSTQVLPILNTKCNSCHTAQAPLMTATAGYAQLVPAYVNTTTPASSKLYINAASGSHYAQVSSSQAAIILQWIKEGAKNN